MRAATSTMSSIEQRRMSELSDTENIRRYWKTHLDHNSTRPFDLVSEKLLAIGSLTIDDYLHAPSTEGFAYDISELALEIPQRSTPTPPPELPTLTVPQGPSSKDVNTTPKMQMVARLHQACQRTFGSVDALRFEYLEENGSNSKRCILTIIRPNGASRSYATDPIFSRKNEAKAQVAALAIEMGAIEFIVSGHVETSKGKKGPVLAPLDAPGQSDIEAVETDIPALPLQDDDAAIKQIEECCMDWRAGVVKPEWIPLTEPKLGTKHGCALRVKLSKHSYRVYSCNASFKDPSKAKGACAQIALQQGVLSFIQFGCGQKQPARRPAAHEASAVGSDDPPLVGPISLQAFYERLPRPLPESFGEKSAVEINAPGWLNLLIQGARGGKLSTSFIWIADGSLGLHGCLLRIERPSESRSYFVDPLFAKRVDAKAAVCLQAMSEGVASYIRGVGEAISHKVTQSMRKWANEHVFPTIGLESHKINPGRGPTFTFERERDAYGCTMKLDLVSNPKPQETRTFRVPVEYRTKADAKTAVACVAADQGAVEFLRFRGQAPPPGYVPFISRREEIGEAARAKRKQDTDHSSNTEGPSHKRFRSDDGFGSREEGEIPLLQTKEEAMARRAAMQGRDFKDGNKKDKHRWKGKGRQAFNSGSGPGPVYGRAQAGRSTGQHHPPGRQPMPATPHHPPHDGNASGSHVVGMVRVPPLPPPAPPLLNPYAPPPDGRLGYGGMQAAFYHDPAPHPPSEPFHARASSAYGSGRPYHDGVDSVAHPYHYSHSTEPHSAGYPHPRRDFSPYTHSSAHPQAYQHPHLPPYHGPPKPTFSGMDVRRPTAPESRPPPMPKQDRPCVPKATSSKKDEADSSYSKHDSSSAKAATALKTKKGGKVILKQGNQESTSVSDTLMAYCKREGLPQPQFHHKCVMDDGKQKFNVWAIMGKERLELHASYETLKEGQERVSKQILARLKGKVQKIAN